MRFRLDRFWKPFFEFLSRSETRENAATMVQGLLSDLKRKNTESIADRFGQKRRALQRFVGEALWDHQTVGAGDFGGSNCDAMRREFPPIGQTGISNKRISVENWRIFIITRHVDFSPQGEKIDDYNLHSTSTFRREPYSRSPQGLVGTGSGKGFSRRKTRSPMIPAETIAM